MVTLSKQNPVCTVITRMETRPGEQEKLVNLLKLSIRGMKKHPGFVSACVHQSTDGTAILNYMQWRSQADFENFVQQPRRAEAETEFMKIHVETGKVRVERGVYEIVFLLEKGDS